MEKKRMQFCIECREETMYRLQQVTCSKCIKDKMYEFTISEAVCEKCGGTVNIPGLIDSNVHEMDKQYRAMEGIVSINDIRNLMEIYKIGKAPLSLALGFGEITITRYLSGQVPSKEYSDIIRKALESPTFMLEKLNENIGKIGETAYKKAMNAAKEVEPLFTLSEKMLLTISYMFKKTEEITPLALQKMLYFIQGIYMVLFDAELFSEECRAWAHGPVFKEVYEVFKTFKYNPIDDIRFSMFQNRFKELSDNEKKVINLVLESFGIYSGKTLERITHEESPWLNARENSLPGKPSDAVISKESIKMYFSEVAQKYEIDNVDGIKKYISSRLSVNDNYFIECGGNIRHFRFLSNGSEESMNIILNNVLSRKNDIINKTMEYQKLNTNHIPHNHSKEFTKLCDFFDSNFNEDEIMVIQSIMYFGRECFPDGIPECEGSIEETIERWMKNLFFSFGKKINKDIEISQMVEKGLKIGTYFKLGFEYFEK